MLENVSLKIQHYKCMGSEPQGYDQFLPINLIIGRNASGKSTLIDLIEYAVSGQLPAQRASQIEPPRIVLKALLTPDIIRTFFPESHSGGYLPGNHWEFGKRWINKPIEWTIGPQNKVEFRAVEPPFKVNVPAETTAILAKRMGNPFSSFLFKRLLSDRDMRRDGETGALEIKPDGTGATHVIQSFVNNEELPSDLVEQKVLDDLNEIFEPDASFTRIVVQKVVVTPPEWEVFLEEPKKGRIALSQTGSGIKTILLVLCFIHLLPRLSKRPLHDFLFGFEELENNLHPALQRRLLLYLRKTALEKKCAFFLTTHSSVVIDLFASDDKAQILHVTHDGDSASVKRVTTYVENRGILDDLDVRASDLLQSNGILWVEGPSDRLYLNRWIELWSDGKLKEGAHYQCVFYGGRLLAHLQAGDPEIDLNDVVKILRVNRNAIVMIDSDKSSPEDAINSTKERIAREINSIGGIAWVTAGKTVENYLSIPTLQEMYPAADLLGQYQDFETYLESLKQNEGKRFSRNKVLFAEKACPLISAADLANVLDLGARSDDICTAICRWNGIVAKSIAATASKPE